MKKTVFTFAVTAVLIISFVFNFTFTSFGRKSARESEDLGVSFFAEQEKKSVSKAEKSIAQAQQVLESKAAAQQYKAQKDKTAKAIKAVESGKLSFQTVFKDVCFAGDSLMEGLRAYNVLNSKKIVARVSASLKHLEESTDEIIVLKPKILILHYGLNMLGTTDSAVSSFVNRYKKDILALKKALPKTKIIVSLIFPVLPKVKGAEFKYIGKFNASTKKMCSEIGVSSLDSASVLNAHSECYEPDGIHQSRQFYIHWLKFIMKKEGLS